MTINIEFYTECIYPTQQPPCLIYDDDDENNYQSVSNQIENAITQGIVVVAGTGNTGWEVTSQIMDCVQCLPVRYTPYPAAYDFQGLGGVIGVSATDINDQFGASTTGITYNPDPQLDFIDVAAPGIDILSTYLNNGYNIERGTSFSSPHAAALAGLILSVNSTLTPAQVEQAMINSAVDLGDPGRDKYFGHGRIDAYEAIKEAMPIKISEDITANTTWGAGDYALFETPDPPPYINVDGVNLIIDAGAVAVVESGVRVRAINAGHITIDPNAKIILEPGAEIIAGGGGFVTDNGGDIRFKGPGACMATTGGVLKFASGITRTVSNNGIIAGFESNGIIEIQDNAVLSFETGAKFKLEPGLTIKLGDNAEIIVKSDLIAKGTAANPITFTSLYTKPNSGQYWKWLQLDGSEDGDTLFR